MLFRSRRWFQLAPYYGSYVHLIDQQTDYDQVRTGSQTGGFKTGPNPYESIAFYQILGPSKVSDVVTAGTSSGVRLMPSQSSIENVSFFYKRQVNEMKAIPRIPKYDGAALNEFFYNTTRNIDGTKYTPNNGNYTYFKKKIGRAHV